MPQIVSAITPFLSVASTAGSLASTGSNIYQGYQNQQYQDKLRSLAQNPQALNQYEQGFVQPLSAGLTQGVENQAQGYAAERGLSQSPALQSEIVSQALAPYIQSQQQSGYSNALQALGLGGGATPSNTQASLTSGLSGLSGLSKLGQGGSAAASASGDPYSSLGSAQELAGLTPTVPYAPGGDSSGLQSFLTSNGGF